MVRLDAEVPLSTVVAAVCAEDPRGIPLARPHRAGVPEQRAKRAALDAHVRAKYVLAVEIEEQAPERRFEERHAALMTRCRPGILALAVIAHERGGIRRQQVFEIPVDGRECPPAMKEAVSPRKPDELVGHRSHFGVDRAGHGAIGHEKDRHRLVPLAHRAEQQCRLLVRTSSRSGPASS